jgi:hypothetical protein
LCSEKKKEEHDRLEQIAIAVSAFWLVLLLAGLVFVSRVFCSESFTGLADG